MDKIDTSAADEFGKLFIELVRDTAIMFTNVRMRNAIEGRFPHELYKPMMDKLTDEDREAFQQFMITTVDTALHQLLLFFEQSEEFKIMLETTNGLEELKKFLLGDLQGYIFIWGEKYSKYPQDI